MKRMLVLLFTALLASSSVFAYDQGLAQRFEQFYQPFGGKACAKALQLIPAPDFVKAVKAKEIPLVLDVRTTGETAVLGIALENSLAVPMNQVFTPEILARIPTQGKVVVVCKSGARAMAVAMGLRQIGFENIFVLKGGLGELNKALSPKTAY
jgi:rhodanese-related sulfurtransferase